MLTTERHQLILDRLNTNHVSTIQELVELTKASESTIRRDLSELERQEKLVRVHGGAEKKHLKSDEPSFPEKSSKNIQFKKLIGSAAAELVEPNECIYLDAGTTTYEMIPYLKDKKITVVTNGLTHIDLLGKYQITTYLIGGYVKHNTRAIIGHGAQESMNNYRFDKCFLGVNGFDLSHGFTTPDPEEASVKQTAMRLSQQCFVLADSSKHNQVSFAKVANLEDACLIVNEIEDDILAPFKNKTNVKVVSS